MECIRTSHWSSATNQLHSAVRRVVRTPGKKSRIVLFKPCGQNVGKEKIASCRHPDAAALELNVKTVEFSCSSIRRHELASRMVSAPTEASAKVGKEILKNHQDGPVVLKTQTGQVQEPVPSCESEDMS